MIKMTMKCIKDASLLPEENGGMLCSEETFIALENDEEREAYKYCFDSSYNKKNSEYYKGYWDCYMTEKCDQDTFDENVYYYIFPTEALPKIGETYKDADNNIWERLD